MKYDSVSRRLTNLEGRDSDAAVLHFPDGSTRRLDLPKPLNLLLSTFALLSYYAKPGVGYDEGRERRFPDVPESHLERIQLIGCAERIETNDKVLRWIHANSVEISKAKSEEEDEPPHVQ